MESCHAPGGVLLGAAKQDVRSVHGRSAAKQYARFELEGHMRDERDEERHTWDERDEGRHMLSLPPQFAEGRFLCPIHCPGELGCIVEVYVVEPLS